MPEHTTRVAGSPLDRGVELPRGVRDPYRAYPLTPVELQELRALVGDGTREPDAGVLFPEGPRPAVWVFPVGTRSLAVTERLAALRDHELSTAERAWVVSDPLGVPGEAGLLAELDQLLAALAAAVPSPSAEDAQRARLRVSLRRRRARTPVRRRRR